MSTPVSPPPAEDLPDPEEAVAALDPETGEDYDPPEVVDPDREAAEADQVEQAIEVPVDDGDPDEGEEA
ncbi:hypothetical protein SAMN05216184_103151 [Georgenia satyanarayanai]|uniref:Uncharacterized protein n=1 Tax=Georgenia satyanarayanai TaxID=860221 RepID=A0A2Y9ABP2_9MICO|nr:hypothetical protein [Georgenia satyanarayanai]PYG00580.1 hypothetical protein A8987_103151 [Georgenia satyanarayanai]SSA39969.1 hypothetical protein SAMN05216184_103151 [Georgenia satyanarayanai]